jgi:DNA-binding response OmpR family regulator
MGFPMKPLLLVAEGDPELCEMYWKFLAQRGFEVETATHGLECLEKLRRRMPAVLVLDRELRWGGADGVLAWLREQRPTARISVVLMASAGCSSEVSGDIRPPVVRLLARPFALTALLVSVRAALAENRREDWSNGNSAAAWGLLIE